MIEANIWQVFASQSTEDEIDNKYGSHCPLVVSIKLIWYEQEILERWWSVVDIMYLQYIMIFTIYYGYNMLYIHIYYRFTFKAVISLPRSSTWTWKNLFCWRIRRNNNKKRHSSIKSCHVPPACTNQITACRVTRLYFSHTKSDVC